MFRFLLNFAQRAMPANCDSSTSIGAPREGLLSKAILAVVIALCLGFVSPNDAAADETFITDIYIAVPTVGGELDGEFVYQSYYSEDGFVLVPKKAFAKDDVIALDDKFEGAKGLKTAINKSIATANKEFGKAGVTFEVRNIFFVSATNKHITGSYKSDEGFFDLGVKGGKSTLLTGFEKLTSAKTDSFNILLAPLTEGDSKIEEGWAEQPGNTSILDIGRSVNQKDGGFILLHELGHNLGLGHQAGADPYNTAMAPKSPSRPHGKESKIAKPSLSAGEISTIKGNVKKGTYNNYKKPTKSKSTTQTSQAAPSGYSEGALAAISAGALNSSPNEILTDLFLPQRPAMTFTAGAFTGQLDRKSTGMLGTDLAAVISSANLVYLDNDTNTDGQFATAAFNTTGLDNQLWGDWFTIDPATSFSTGFSAVHVESNVDQRIGMIPVGAGNNLLIFSPEGQGGGLGGGLNAGARDAENVLYSNAYKSHNYELKKEVSFDTSFGRMSPNLTFGYGGTEITERFSGQVVGINQDFAYRNMLDIDTYSLGFGVSMEAPFGKFASFPVEIYAGASATANFNDYSGHSKLDLSGIVNATEMRSLSGSETTGSYEANVGLSFEINDVLEFVVGARIKSFDVGGIEIAPEQAARVRYDDATETLIFAAIKAGFGKGDANLFGLSDRRLKRDITHLATLDNGIKLYSFKYLWDDQIHVGVMAQDLLSNENFRHAVVMMQHGFYAVKYRELGLRMTTLNEWKEADLASVVVTPASHHQVSDFVPVQEQ